MRPVPPPDKILFWSADELYSGLEGEQEEFNTLPSKIDPPQSTYAPKDWPAAEYLNYQFNGLGGGIASLFDYVGAIPVLNYFSPATVTSGAKILGHCGKRDLLYRGTTTVLAYSINGGDVWVTQPLDDPASGNFVALTDDGVGNVVGITDDGEVLEGQSTTTLSRHIAALDFSVDHSHVFHNPGIWCVVNANSEWDVQAATSTNRSTWTNRLTTDEDDDSRCMAAASDGAGKIVILHGIDGPQISAHVSTDGGLTWATTNDAIVSPASYTLSNMIWDPLDERFYCFVMNDTSDLDSGGKLYRSVNGSVWTVHQDLTSKVGQLRIIQRLNTLFVGFFESVTKMSGIVWSLDGNTWHRGGYSALNDSALYPTSDPTVPQLTAYGNATQMIVGTKFYRGLRTGITPEL